MRRLLEKRGDEVLTAEDGLSALKILKNHTPDVIFVDQVMPNISGDKLCRIIRSRPRLADVCIIILSAIAAEAEFRFGEFGANYCIAKGPFDKMSTHILALLYRLDAQGECGFSDRIIGREDVYYRQVSRELLYSKKHAEVILNNLGEGVMELTLQGEIVYANPTAVRMLDSAEELLLGTRFQDLFKEDDLHRVLQLIEQIGSEARASTEESTIEIKGRQIWMDLIRIDDEAHQAITVIMNDVSRQKQDADAILEREEKYRSLLENLNDIIFETDTEGILTYINPPIEEICGYRPQELIGFHFNRLLHPEDAPLSDKRLDRILEGEHPGPQEFRLLCKSGDVRWLRVSTRAYFEGGRIKGIRGVATDITQPLLLQEELVRSERLAATGQLAASITHEIDEPLGTIDSKIGAICKQHPDDTQLQSDLQDVKDAVKGLRDTVNNLRDLSRLDEEGRRPTRLNEVIEKSLALLQGQLKTAKVALNLELDPEIPDLNVSAGQVSQLLLHLTNNAAEALTGVFSPDDGKRKSKKGKAKLTVRTGIESGHVFIRFLDNGPGIAEDDLQRIFDPFYTRKKKIGLGVGLSICHRITAEYGGQIFAENLREGGAQITVLLPAS
jgi:PAS domain S-box-containing protein